MKSDLVDITVEVHHRTEKAVLVSVDGNRQGAVWLPLSAIEIAMQRGSTKIAEVTLAEPLALQKGLI